MKSLKNLPIVAGVTACDTPEGTNLIGIGVVAYDSNPGQVESLVTPKLLLATSKNDPGNVLEDSHS